MSKKAPAGKKKSKDHYKNLLFDLDECHSVALRPCDSYHYLNIGESEEPMSGMKKYDILVSMELLDATSDEELLNQCHGDRAHDLTSVVVPTIHDCNDEWVKVGVVSFQTAKLNLRSISNEDALLCNIEMGSIIDDIFDEDTQYECIKKICGMRHTECPDDLIVIHSLFIDERWRGRGFGLGAVQTIIYNWGYSESALFAMRAIPLFCTSKNRKSGVNALIKYFGNMGFKRVGKTDTIVLPYEII